MVDRARELIRGGARRLILQSATGSGKTLCAAHIIHSASGRGNRTLFVAHRKELIEQASAKLTAYDVNHGVIMANHWRRRPQLPVQVASIQTLIRREPPHTDLLIIDEGHRVMGASYRTLIDHYPDAVVLGLTATPTRIDGKGLGEVFEHIVSGPSISELIQQGYHVPVRHFAPFIPALAAVRTVAGDYDEHQLEDLMDRPQIVGDIVDHWKTLAADRQTIVFATGIEHSKHLAAAFVAAGVSAVHIDGTTKAAERDDALVGLSTYRYQVVCNVGIGVEGLDIPVISCVVLARPTKSLTLYLQAAGRGSRPAPDKTDLIILDHAG
ncbi:MAG: DEAD/DEAH box helicase, partial [Sulfobacillus sp.]